ncbi:hypothetical protein [Actinoplanes sp. NPDC051859]|uniref:hypothetical protein n=1 Tax=Actinoplanes sp. NPDC051859 TaxID=3363909 RepID=UPI00378BA642
MDEERARRVVETLRARNVFAHVKLPHAGITQYGLRVVLPDGREAIWDTDGTAGLEAQIMRNGVLVGFVPSIPGSENFGEAEVIEAIACADYDQPIGRSRPAAASPAPAVPPRGPAAPPRGPASRPLGLAERLRRAFRD